VGNIYKWETGGDGIGNDPRCCPCNYQLSYILVGRWFFFCLYPDLFFFLFFSLYLILTFLIYFFYIILIIFYYYLNKKTHYNIIFIKILSTLYYTNHFLLLFKKKTKIHLKYNERSCHTRLSEKQTVCRG